MTGSRLRSYFFQDEMSKLTVNLRISVLLFICAIVGPITASDSSHYEQSSTTTEVTSSTTEQRQSTSTTPSMVTPAIVKSITHIPLFTSTSTEAETKPHVTTTTDISMTEPKPKKKNDPSSMFENKLEKSNHDEKSQQPMNEKEPSYSYGGNSYPNFFYPNFSPSTNFVVNSLYNPIRKPQFNPTVGTFSNPDSVTAYNPGNIWNPYQNPHERPLFFWVQYPYTKSSFENLGMLTNDEQYVPHAASYFNYGMNYKSTYNSESISNKNYSPLIGLPVYPNRDYNMALTNYHPIRRYARNTPFYEVTDINAENQTPEKAVQSIMDLPISTVIVE